MPTGHCPKCSTSFSVTPGQRFRCVCGVKLRAPSVEDVLDMQLPDREEDYESPRAALPSGESAGTASMVFAFIAIISIPLVCLTPLFLIGVCGGCLMAFVIGMCGRGTRANFGTSVGFVGVAAMVCVAVFMSVVIKELIESEKANKNQQIITPEMMNPSR